MAPAAASFCSASMSRRVTRSLTTASTSISSAAAPARDAEQRMREPDHRHVDDDPGRIEQREQALRREQRAQRADVAQAPRSAARRCAARPARRDARDHAATAIRPACCRRRPAGARADSRAPAAARAPRRRRPAAPASVSPLWLASTRSKTCSMNSAGTSSSRLTKNDRPATWSSGRLRRVRTGFIEEASGMRPCYRTTLAARGARTGAGRPIPRMGGARRGMRGGRSWADRDVVLVECPADAR